MKLKTPAMKKYKLASSDMDSIMPIEVTRNLRGGGNMVQKFNECDVKELSERLKSAPSSSGAHIGCSSSIIRTSAGGTFELAVPKGPKILRTKAAKEFNIKPVQLDCIKPISIEPNPHGGNGPPMRYYNRCDVEALATQVRAAAPSGSTKAPRRTSGYFDDDYNPFDGLSRIEAAELFAEKTGIVDTAAFEDDY